MSKGEGGSQMASQDQDLKKAAGAAKGAVNTAQTVKTAVKTAKLATTAAKAGAGPAGWVMLAAQFAPQISQLADRLKKIAAGIGGYLFYLLLKLALKIAGLIAGLAFGAVTGLPLLAIPVAGPFLYAGWTAYWGYRGWTNPLGTMHLATHPWELVTKPLAQGWGYTKGAFNTVTGGPIEVGGGIFSAGAGVVSAVGNTIAAAATAIWNFGTGLAGSAFGGLASGLNFVVGGLTTAAIPAGMVMIPVVGGISVITYLGLQNEINTLSSVFTPKEDQVIAPSQTGDNIFFTISKKVSDGHLQNSELPATITFTISLTAKEENLSQISMRDELRVQGQEDTFEITNIGGVPILETCDPAVPSNLAAGLTWNCKIELDVPDNENYRDSTIRNTITVAGAPGDQPREEDTAFVTVAIGETPTDCPSGWPTDHGVIWQGPMGATSHAKESADGWPAIDIAQPLGTPTYATFTGRVFSVVNDKDGWGFGAHVIIEADCNGTRFQAMWAHLKLNSIDPAIKEGAEIKFHDLIGEIDDTGDSEGNHLHYALNGIKMEEPYIPQNPKTANCNDNVSCDVSW